VLIQGESGTGKELVARAICKESPRAGAPFIKVNCAAIPETLIESEFFGHEKGSFTGAMNKREGRFELAHTGTILLDEVSEVSPQVQAKLLRVLQEREIERVGGNRPIKVDVRVIATTNRNLEQSVEKKEFRQDLYFRLNVVPIVVPPLRERAEDVTFLAEQFMMRMARKHGVRVTGISAACNAALRAHSWPGNVRELQNIIERAVILASDGEDLQPEHLGFVPSGAAGGVSAAAAAVGVGGDEIIPLGELEKRQILHAVEKCGGNRTQAAKKLGISIRTLRNKLHEYGVGAKEEAGEEEEAVG
jgi:transcriptional regulator with PAS, ATPase and Fis domain